MTLTPAEQTELQDRAKLWRTLTYLAEKMTELVALTHKLMQAEVDRRRP